MPLTPEEQQELAQLQAELGPSAMPDVGVELDFSNQQVPTPARLDFERKIATNQMAKQTPPIFYSEDQSADTKQKIFNYLITKEPDRDIVLAAMANMEAESQFIPSRLQGDPKNEKKIKNWFKKTKAGRGTGLIQWDDRRQALEKFAAKRKKRWDDLETQLDFMLHEFKTSEKEAYKKLKQAPNLEVKTRLFATQFERAGTASADAVVRGKITDEQREEELQRRTENALRLRREFGER